MLGRVFVISKIDEKPWRLTEQTDKNSAPPSIAMDIWQCFKSAACNPLESRVILMTFHQIQVHVHQ